MRRLAICVSVALAVVACSKPASRPGVMEDRAIIAEAPPGKAAAPSPAPVAGPQLAYSYSATIVAPQRRIPDLLTAHARACRDAGPAACQVVGSSLETAGRSGSAVGGSSLHIRAVPAWIGRFSQGLRAGVEAAGGRLASDQVQSEDLTRSLVDTEAQVRAQTTLRDRLQALLASHPGGLKDLLDVERELARVQGELDARASELAVLRQRVDTSTLDIAYAPDGPQALELLRGSAAALGLVLVMALPWAAAVLAVLLAVVGLKRLRNRRRPQA